MKYILVFIFLALFQTQSIAQIYQWKDDNGKLHFSDKRPITNNAIKNVRANTSKMVSGVSDKSSSIVDRANNIQSRKSNKPSVASNFKKKKIKHKGSIYKPGFRESTGFDNADNMDKARDKCKGRRSTDCSTRTLINKKKGDNWAKTDLGRSVIKQNGDRAARAANGHH